MTCQSALLSRAGHGAGSGPSSDCAATLRFGDRPVRRTTQQQERRFLDDDPVRQHAGVPLRHGQAAARHADPRTTTTIEPGRESFDRTPTTSSAPSSAAAETPGIPARPSSGGTLGPELCVAAFVAPGGVVPPICLDGEVAVGGSPAVFSLSWSGPVSVRLAMSLGGGLGRAGERDLLRSSRPGRGFP